MIHTRLQRFKRSLEKPYDVYNRIEVSRSALLDNLGFFREKTGLQVIPVLKGNAYGHGIEQVASALKDAVIPYIAVDGYFEALKVRAVSRHPVLVMGMIKPHNFTRLRLVGTTFVIHDEATIHALAKRNRPIKIHLELNTGMNRNGISPADIDKYAKLLQKYPNLKLEGVMSHLADADGTKSETIDNAVRMYDEAVDKLLSMGFTPTMFHISQSAGSIRAKSRHANTVRVGLGLYGINPFPAGNPLYRACQKLKPALRLISTISRVNDLKRGDKISYNYIFTAPKDMRVGVLPLGYHEGVNRQLSNAGAVKFKNHYLPIVGKVCMNHTMIDLSESSAKPGDEVTVYSDEPGDQNSVTSLASTPGLFPYTTLTDLSPDVRRYVAG